jgi:hypothetical protein
MRYALVSALVALLAMSDIAVAGQGLPGPGAPGAQRACCGDGCCCGPEAPCCTAAPEPVPGPAKIANSPEVQLPRVLAMLATVPARLATVSDRQPSRAQLADDFAGPPAADRPLFLLESALLL